MCGHDGRGQRSEPLLKVVLKTLEEPVFRTWTTTDSSEGRKGQFLVLLPQPGSWMFLLHKNTFCSETSFYVCYLRSGKRKRRKERLQV